MRRTRSNPDREFWLLAIGSAALCASLITGVLADVGAPVLPVVVMCVGFALALGCGVIIAESLSGWGEPSDLSQNAIAPACDFPAN